MRAFALLTALAAGLIVAADEPDKKKDVKKEVEALQGRWTVTKLEREGEDLAAQFGKLEAEFKDRGYSVPGIKATFELDPSKTPKAMDISYEEGPAAGQTVKAIYKLEGDTLTICRALGESGGRPTEFAAPSGSGKMLFVFERVK